MNASVEFLNTVFKVQDVRGERDTAMQPSLGSYKFSLFILPFFFFKSKWVGDRMGVKLKEIVEKQCLFSLPQTLI